MKETGLTGKRRSTTIAATPDDGKSQRKRRRRRRECLRSCLAACVEFLRGGRPSDSFSSLWAAFALTIHINALSRILAYFPHSRIFARTSRISGFISKFKKSLKITIILAVRRHFVRKSSAKTLVITSPS